MISRRVQPRNRIGLLFVLVAKGRPLLLAHVLVAFPTGRLRTLPRRLVPALGEVRRELSRDATVCRDKDDPFGLKN
ncbi:hypothetical protein [Saccharothrix sp. HUAS TT1]|uniref:hypothetical protein n=1 Tax=unclassified Saccharothrix TaxID=2593673 RepID=UPI00345B86FF